jgi:hypothetical protein
MLIEQVEYWAMWASIAAAAGTLVAAGVTAWMAIQTAQTAKATADMARVAREETAFLRAEADERAKACVRVLEVRANTDKQLGVSGWFSVLNVGPSRAYGLSWRAWYEFGSHPGEFGSGKPENDDLLCIERGQKHPVDLRLALPEGTRDKWLPHRETEDDPEWRRQLRNTSNSPKAMWLIVTWLDAEDCAWAHLVYLEGRSGTEAFEVKRRWPEGTDRGVRLSREDPLAAPENVPAAALRDEVQRRLVSTS